MNDPGAHTKDDAAEESSDGPPPESTKKPKKPKVLSRPQRWQAAIDDIRTALEEAKEAAGKLESALSDLRGVQEEYEEWRDNIPENLQSTELYSKLETVCDLDVEGKADDITSAIEEAESVIDEAEQVDLPRGFGRD